MVRSDVLDTLKRAWFHPLIKLDLDRQGRWRGQAPAIEIICTWKGDNGGKMPKNLSSSKRSPMKGPWHLPSFSSLALDGAEEETLRVANNRKILLGKNKNTIKTEKWKIPLQKRHKKGLKSHFSIHQMAWNFGLGPAIARQTLQRSIHLFHKDRSVKGWLDNTALSCTYRDKELQKFVVHLLVHIWVHFIRTIYRPATLTTWLRLRHVTP